MKTKKTAAVTKAKTASKPQAAAKVATKPPAKTPVKVSAPVLAVPAATAPAKPVARRKKPPAPRAATLVDARPEHTLPIYQIYFEPGQRAQLDPEFIPFDNAGKDDPLREFAVFEALAKDEGLRLAPLWGALSWRFTGKTGLTGQALRQAIEQHPGCDLYYCNPFPEHEALFTNGWQQGLTAHPAFTELCSAVFGAAGLDLRELKTIQPSHAFSACNYFVGSPAFWATYLPWVRDLLTRARAQLPAAVLSVLDSRLSDPRDQHAGSTYWPFIIERLLPLYLHSAGQGLKVHRITLPVAEARLNSHLLRLREMKDVAHRTRSPWLHACWLNYRNLYLLQTAGRDWCKRYLSLISPVEVDFW
jgi:hypothetical protein